MGPPTGTDTFIRLQSISAGSLRSPAVRLVCPPTGAIHAQLPHAISFFCCFWQRGLQTIVRCPLTVVCCPLSVVASSVDPNRAAIKSLLLLPGKLTFIILHKGSYVNLCLSNEYTLLHFFKVTPGRYHHVCILCTFGNIECHLFKLLHIKDIVFTNDRSHCQSTHVLQAIAS